MRKVNERHKRQEKIDNNSLVFLDKKLYKKMYIWKLNNYIRLRNVTEFDRS